MRTIMVNFGSYTPLNYVEVRDFNPAAVLMKVENEDVFSNVTDAESVMLRLPSGSQVLVKSGDSFRLFRKP